MHRISPHAKEELVRALDVVAKENLAALVPTRIGILVVGGSACTTALWRPRLRVLKPRNHRALSARRVLPALRIDRTTRRSPPAGAP